MYLVALIVYNIVLFLTVIHLQKFDETFKDNKLNWKIICGFNELLS